MKSFDRLIISVFCLLGAIIFLANLLIINIPNSRNKLFKVDLNRVEQEFQNGNTADSANYDTILGIYEYDGENFYDSLNEYVIREFNGTLYRIEYDDKTDPKSSLLIIINTSFGILFLLMIITLLYVRKNIIKPFSQLSELPFKLAKGTLSEPIKEHKSRYFGKFLWGLDMLREKLEKSHEQELNRAKTEKTLFLSISHDIKTPISAIKLYAKAISKGLYSGQKLTESAENINLKADEIESYVNEMIGRLNSDFMSFKVNSYEFYLEQVIDRIKNYYSEKLKLLRIDFTVERCNNCLILGDPDKLEEVLQNIIENAVKYGSGHEISVSFSDEENCRLISVTNSGCTLPESELTSIFNSFWRGSNVGNQQGSGLGLYICRRLMNAMGGDIFAEISGEYISVTVVCRKVT